MSYNNTDSDDGEYRMTNISSPEAESWVLCLLVELCQWPADAPPQAPVKLGKTHLLDCLNIGIIVRLLLGGAEATGVLKISVANK